jgi:hypothetical protein
VLCVVDLAISLVNDVCQLIAKEDLLWRDVLAVTSASVEKGYVIFKLGIHVDVVQNFLQLPRTVVQVQEAEFIYITINQKDILGVQVGVDDVLRMQNLKQVNDLNCDFNSLKLGKKSELFRLQIFHQKAQV